MCDNRKIKSLSVTIPAVVGPYQNIHATLVQTGMRPLSDTPNKWVKPEILLPFAHGAGHLGETSYINSVRYWEGG